MNHVGNPFQSSSILSICPGVRGLERGLERAIGPVRVAAYVEIEAFIIENLVCQMEQGLLDPAPIWTDVKTFNGEIFRRKIDGIVGGYPCQPFSNAGKRGGSDDPRHLWPHIRRIMEQAKPWFAFFENVRGHLTLGFDIVHRELKEMGYCVEAGIFTAQEVGAPQERQRLFILAMANPYSSSTVGGDGNFFNTTVTNEREAQRKNGKRNRNELGNGDKTMANSNSARCGKLGGAFPIQSEQLSVERSGIDLYPAPQGYFQYSWEEPRAVKPGLGCTIDGYNFRIDLLRAFGNSVVEQTVELAFKTLLQKHLNNQLYA